MKILATLTLIFSISIGSVWAQDNQWKTAAERFNHFNIVLYNYMNANDFLDETKQMAWDNRRVDDFASYYFGDAQGLKKYVQDFHSSMYNLVREKGLAPTPELYRNALEQLYAMNLLEAPRGMPCHKAQQTAYFNSLVENLNLLNTQLEVALKNIHTASLEARKNFTDCVKQSEGN
jgi:hypothetical protein